jgi:putative heme transporter
LAAFLLYLTQGLTVPLILAIVIGAVFAPWVDFLEKLHVKRWAGTFIVLFLLLGVAFGTVALVVEGIVSQGAEIAENIEAGITEISGLLADAGLDPDLPQKALDQATESEGVLGGGLVGVVVGGISSAASFIIGGFVALNILFFLMKDAHTISGWMRERASGVVATTLLSDSARSLRAYFRGKTIVAASSSITVYIGALLLGVPLAASVRRAAGDR